MEKRAAAAEAKVEFLEAALYDVQGSLSTIAVQLQTK